MHLPLFPLNAVLCPGGKLGIRVFEQRYLSMITRSLKNDELFAVVLAKSDAKTGAELPFYQKATLAKIIDFDTDDDGVLNVIAEGLRAVDIIGAERAEDGLWLGYMQSDHGADSVNDGGNGSVKNSVTDSAMSRAAAGDVTSTKLAATGGAFVGLDAALTRDFEELVVVLKALTKHPEVQELGLGINYKDPEEVGLRLIELLPIKPEKKQALFELNDPILRLSKIVSELAEFSI